MSAKTLGLIDAIESVIGEIGDEEKLRLVTLAIDSYFHQIDSDARMECADILRRDLLPKAERRFQESA